MTRWRLGLVAAAAFTAACASTPAVAVRPGEATARRKCGGCHRVPAPDGARAEAALAALRAHGDRIALTADETTEVEQYLRAAD